MTRTEILLTMHAEISRRIFRTMQLGGNTKQLSAMEDEGLISSQSRYGGGHRQRNWYLSDEQHAALTFLFAEMKSTLKASDVVDWAVERWQAEVANRPLQNVHRRSLDTTWRQVIRKFGGDDIVLCGPPHDELTALSKSESRT